MNGNEALQSLVNTIDERLKRRGEMTLTLGSFRALVLESLRPGSYVPFERPESPAQAPLAPEYPKLKVRYDRATHAPLEHKVIHTLKDEIPYMDGGWYTRPMSELAQLEGR